MPASVARFRTEIFGCSDERKMRVWPVAHFTRPLACKQRGQMGATHSAFTEVAPAELHLSQPCSIFGIKALAVDHVEFLPGTDKVIFSRIGGTA